MADAGLVLHCACRAVLVLVLVAVVLLLALLVQLLMRMAVAVVSPRRRLQSAVVAPHDHRQPRRD